MLEIKVVAATPGMEAWMRRRKHSFLMSFIQQPGTAETNCRESPANPSTYWMPMARYGVPRLLLCVWARQAAARSREDAAAFLQPRRGEEALLHAEHGCESWAVIKQLSLNSSLYVFCYTKHYSSEGS